MPGFSSLLPKTLASLAAIGVASLAQCAEAQEREAPPAALKLLPVQLDLSTLDIHEQESPQTTALTLFPLSGEATKPVSSDPAWPGERIGVIGVALTGKGYLGEHEVSASLASYETVQRADPRITGALALKAPLAALGQFSRPGYGLRLIGSDALPLRQPGYSASLAWGLPGSFRIEARHSDTLGDPEVALVALQGSWQSRSDTISLITDPARGWQLRVQSFQGRTIATGSAEGTAWIDTSTRAASAMVTRSLGPNLIAARVDAFATRNRGSVVSAADNEDGWALSLAASRMLGPLAMARAELLHLESRRTGMIAAPEVVTRSQDQVQVSMQVKW